MGITVEPGVSEQVLALTTGELRRMEAANEAWQGAYLSMKVFDGDTSGWRVSGAVVLLRPWRKSRS